VDVLLGTSLNASPPRELLQIVVEGGLRRNIYEVRPDQLPVGETGRPITAAVVVPRRKPREPERVER
jgi:hypothetical protein